MTSNRIKEIALIQFAENGYEGTSLAQIADEVGIKKQSIYSHFKGKDELFLQICRDAFVNELNFVMNYLDSNHTQSLHDFLFGFLQHYKERYEENDNTKFWLRTSFFPPAHLYDPVVKYAYDYLDKLEALFIPILEKGEISSTIDSKRATTAYLGVLDGIFVEMLFGGPDRSFKRLDASWEHYWRGLSKE